MSDIPKKGVPDPGNSRFRAIYSLNCYEIMLLCLLITLTNRQKLRKIRGQSRYKRKDGQRALCSDYQHQRAANRLIYPRKSLAASSAIVKRIACMVTGGFFMATASQVKFQGFQFPPTIPVLDKVFGVLTPQFSITRILPLLTIISILTLLTFSSDGVIFSEAYAAGTSDKER
jgi:hypothetical protein